MRKIAVLTFIISTLSLAYAQAETATLSTPSIDENISSDPSWKVLAITSYGGGRLGVEGSYKVMDGTWLGLSYTKIEEYKGYETSFKPTAMQAVVVRHFPGTIGGEGFYIGGMITNVETFKTRDYETNQVVNEVSNRVAPMVLAGWEFFPEIYGTKSVIRAGLGYGAGTPYVGDNKGSGRVNLTALNLIYADFGLGVRF